MSSILLLYTGRHFWNRKCRKKTWWQQEFAVFKCEATANSVTGHVCVYSNSIFFRFLRQDTNSGQIESFFRYIYEPGTDSGAESSFYSTTITRIIFVSATGSWRLARVTTPAVATTISPSLTIPFSFSSSTDANKSASVDSARFA